MTITPLHKKVATASTRSSERETLRAAIDDKAAADAALAAQRTAVERADRLVDDAQAKLVRANAAVVSAKENHTAAMAAAIGKGAPVPVSGELRAARSDVAAAEDDLEAVRLASAQLRAALGDHEAEAERAAMAVEVAINGMLAGAGLAAIDRLVALRDEIMDLFSVVCFVRERGGERRGPSFYQVAELMEPLAELQEKMATGLARGATFDDVTGALANPALERWTEAVAVLRFDADAEFP
jgi:hypothetical protein